jgi:hypothetical protein
VNLLEGSSLFARPGRLGLEPPCELRSKPVELAGAVTFGIGGQDGAGPYVAPDRVSGHAKPFGNLAQRDMIAKVPASDDAQYSHVDHYVPLPVAEQVSVLRGSIFDANYCVGWVRIPRKSTTLDQEALPGSHK